MTWENILPPTKKEEGEPVRVQWGKGTILKKGNEGILPERGKKELTGETKQMRAVVRESNRPKKKVGVGQEETLVFFRTRGGCEGGR